MDAKKGSDMECVCVCIWICNHYPWGIDITADLQFAIRQELAILSEQVTLSVSHYHFFCSANSHDYERDYTALATRNKRTRMKWNENRQIDERLQTQISAQCMWKDDKHRIVVVSLSLSLFLILKSLHHSKIKSFFHGLVYCSFREGANEREEMLIKCTLSITSEIFN
jgi:hypothetical protein